MAYLKPALTPDEVKRAGVAQIREQYNALAVNYNKLIEGHLLFCHACNEFHPEESFYSDKRYASGYYPECKKALLLQATDYDKKTNKYSDNREKTMAVFRKLDLPFIESVYQSALSSVQAEAGEKIRQTAYQQMLVMVKSLPNWRGMTWKDSDYDNEEVVEFEGNRHARKEIKKIFGSGFSESDYVFLQDQYDDWRARTQVDSKSQETYVMQICLQLLDIDKDRKNGKDVSNKLKALDILMNAANLQPKQNVANAATDSLTFGQLIEKWEQEKPIPEPAPEFKDVDGIGTYIRVWFTGHLAKALNLKNAFSQEYDDYIKTYTVSKPEVQEEGRADDIYNSIFGKDNG